MMKSVKPIESFNGPQPAAHPLPDNLHLGPAVIVALLLEEQPWPAAPLAEASVHLPRRSKIYVAVYTGPEGGQIWRTTHQTDYAEALQVAREWEAQARAERALRGRAGHKPSSHAVTTSGLTQKEVAMVLGMSERGVRAVERRALLKLYNNPLLRELWRQYSCGELAEEYSALERAEIIALIGLARTPEELRALKKVLHIVGANMPPVPF